MNGTVLKAIFKRDFVSYFSNPTGYAFICVFVILSSLAAFWPPEFFSNNLANLDQLSERMPFILLVFVPAITMSIWAEERRRGTDELLLTLPASDIDVVVGKYLAAVAIFTASLLFSMFSIFLVFSWGLGTPDAGLFFGSFFGYWFVGLAMLAIGMVASFLTSNLTVGFILGAMFNAPLALLGAADLIIKDPVLAQSARQWSAAAQFADFARGVVSLSGVTYFLSITVVMLYLSMVLIGRRHWAGGAEGRVKWGHYLVRTVALLVAAGGVNIWLSNYDSVRLDITSERLNSLAPQTVELIRNLRNNDEVDPVVIDVYVSPDAPSEYAAQKRDLLATLEEMRSISGGKIQVDRHEIETFSDAASLAERKHGISPRPVSTNVRGARSQQEIFMGVAIRSGLDKVVVPFLDKGVPVEYELVRSISTVADEKRKRIGVLKTDAPLFGGFTMQGSTPESELVAELKKQYEVIEVDPTSPITEEFDVLLAVQPSSLAPEAMTNFVDVVKRGQPTAVFEDPAPAFFGPAVPGTAQPKQPPGGMMGMFGGQQPQPKGDIQQLWNLLGVRLDGEKIVWQDFNPYKSFGIIPKTYVFVDQEANDEAPTFSPESEISSGMRQVLFVHPGAFRKANTSKLNFEPLAVTGTQTGSVDFADVQSAMQDAGFQGSYTREAYVLAAQVTGKIENLDDLRTENVEDPLAQKVEEDGEEPSTEDFETSINVVLVADVDCLADAFFQVREIGDDDAMPISWNFQNVTFVLNVLDSLAGDERFIAVRKRERPHRQLTGIENATVQARDKALKEQETFREEAEAEIAAAQSEVSDKVAEIRGRTDLGPQEKRAMMEMAAMRLGRKSEVQIASLQRERDRQIRQSERNLAAEVRSVQDRYKLYALLLPPIPPILVGLLVFFRRRSMEQEGVSKDRLRYGRADRAKPAEEV